MNISLGGDETLHVELEARKLDILSKSFGLEAENCLYLGNELILFALRHQCTLDKQTGLMHPKSNF